MPSGSFMQTDVRCPFFKYDGKQRIVCEGLIDNSSIILTYQNKLDCDTQRNVYCCEHYKKCEVYRMLMSSEYDT